VYSKSNQNAKKEKAGKDSKWSGAKDSRPEHRST